MKFDLIIKNAHIVNHGGRGETDIGINNGIIAKLGDLQPASAGKVIDASGLTILPGVIDSQVHFREPGLTHKDNLAAGARAAARGGVTCVFEMPNTNPATTSVALFQDKLERAKSMVVDHAFYAGATADNAEALVEMEKIRGCCGVKVFMGSSTGSLLVSKDEDIERILRSLKRRAAFHAEDEDRLIARESERIVGDFSSHPIWRDEETAFLATRRLVNIAEKTGKKIHLLHVTTKQEMAFIRDKKQLVSVEVTPQHLTLMAPGAYEKIGAFAQMNPPIRGETHKSALWQALEEGVVDVIGSDHAPHTKEEKNREYPATPSGMPGVQTLVPVMLTHVNAGRLNLERFIDLTSAGPQRLFSMGGKGRLAVGYDADLTIVDMQAKRTITNEQQESLCGWTPFDGMEVTAWPVMTLVRGNLVMREDEILGFDEGNYSQPALFL